jgi:hypothetical protein
MIELPVFPTFLAPKTPDLPAPVLELPRAVLPSYAPVVIPPAATAGTPPVPLAQTAKPAEPAPETQQNLRQLIREALRQAEAAPLVRRVEPSIQAIPKPLAAEVTEIVVPGTSIVVPVPKGEILSAAATTSVISVGATLAATSMFKRLVQVFKPTFKALAAKVQKLRGKPVRTWARQRLSERHRRRVAHRVNRRGF